MDRLGLLLRSRSIAFDHTQTRPTKILRSAPPIREGLGGGEAERD